MNENKIGEAKFRLQFSQIYKVTTAYFVPPIMVLLAKSSLVSKYDLSSLHSIICGAAPLCKKIEIDVKNRIGVKVVRQGYGMSEGEASNVFFFGRFCALLLLFIL